MFKKSYCKLINIKPSFLFLFLLLPIVSVFYDLGKLDISWIKQPSKPKMVSQMTIYKTEAEH